ncbi:aromatic ring-hydroxylating dioxygenase subunit alpha [Rugosimonospora acidiphila]|uniref:Aromatic ring-hydroxylating dioxygenase subunit alpha n=1 Tax=Rugosimonospora acidiphila TaxID=556531 RepID=A0ABP9S1W3_9ACTN
MPHPTTATTTAGQVTGIDDERLVHNSVYLDDKLYAHEQRTLLGRVWNFVAHDTDIPQVGDYLTVQVAGNPVLVIRDESGRVNGFYNVCRHRGAQVLEGAGQCSVMRCPYHWWTYDLNGELKGIPGSPAYENTGFVKEKFGLVPIRTESIFGLHFVCVDEKAPSLREFLGPRIIEVLGTPLETVPMEVIHKQEWAVPINWKLVAENQRDGYHVPFVHPIFRSASPASPYEIVDNGHAVQWTKLDYERLPEELKGSTEHALPGFEGGGGYIMTLFPDLICQVRNNYFMISSSVPEGIDRTVVTRRIFGVVGDDEAKRKIRMAAAEATALASYGDEDVPVLMRQRAGLANWTVPHSLIARGQPATEGTRGDDNRLRQWWQYWRDYVGATTNVSPFLEA